MRKIIYYVAASIDGFIAGLNDDVSKFIYTGNGVEHYLKDLQSFDTVIMGRKTYEFGYQYGVQPGQPAQAYAHMNHYIFSNKLSFENPHAKVKACKADISIIKSLKQSQGTDIYLCGGGEFAGWLLDNEMIDVLKIKLNPILLGRGVKLFGSSAKQCKMDFKKSQSFQNGLQTVTYNILYR